MENKQSIKNVLSFGVKSVDPEILEHLLIGRETNAEYLFKSVEGIVNNGNNQQILVIGQRGMGKTHLLYILYHRCRKFIQSGDLIVAYFSEEEYGIASFFDFLTRILSAFIRWDDHEKGLLKMQLEDLQDTAPANQGQQLENIIRDYIGDKPLLILAENFGDILNSLGRQEQGRLRAWMYENKRVNIIATSQSISDDLDREDRPFYGFFNLYYLKSLSFEDSLRFLISLAKIDGRQDVVDHLETRGKSQVRAIHELVKGNHRLLVTFYEFLKSETLAKLSKHFIKTINDLKPYYETYIRFLPPQQQKILRYIALARKPQQGVSISKNCFIDQKSLSKQLSELVRKNLVEAMPDQMDKRHKLYDINEPLLRISIEVGEHKEGIIALFVDFLSLFYDVNELTTKKMKFTDLLQRCDSRSEKMDFQYEIQAIERAIELKGPNDLVFGTLLEISELSDKGQIELAYSMLEKYRNKLTKNDYVFVSSFVYLLDNKIEEATRAFEHISKEYFRGRNLYTIWGIEMFQLAEKTGSFAYYEEANRIFAEAVRNAEGHEMLYAIWGKALSQIAYETKDNSLFLMAFEKFEKALEFNRNSENTYVNLAKWQMVYFRNSKDVVYAGKAVKSLKTALSVNQVCIGAYLIWGGAISFMDPAFSSDLLELSEFKTLFSKLPLQFRVVLWKSFAGLHHLHFFAEMFSYLKSDLLPEKEKLGPILIEWILNILKYLPITAGKATFESLKVIMYDIQKDLPELGIPLKYIDVFEEYLLGGNKNAAYDLPKEQRLFFERNLLGDVKSS